MTLREALDAVEVHYRTHGQRVAPVTFQRKHLGRILGEATPLSEITSATAAAYQAERLREGAAPATVNRETSLLLRAFSLAARFGAPVARPWVERLRENNARQGFLERDDVEAIVAYLPPADADFVRFLAETGWRRGEATALTWDEVDTDTVRLRPERTKARDGRMFPLTPALRALLKRRREARHGELVFQTEGRPLRLAGWRRACTQAGHPGQHVHDLRRSAARRMERAGVPRSVMLRLIGWRSEDMLRRYCVVAEADLMLAVSRLSGG